MDVTFLVRILQTQELDLSYSALIRFEPGNIVDYYRSHLRDSGLDDTPLERTVWSIQRIGISGSRIHI